MYSTTISSDVGKAALFLESGELVAIPTETVYGLAANACDAAAVAKVFTAKKRPSANPLIVHVDCIEKIALYAAGIPPAAERLLHAFSPGPLTVLLPGNGTLPSIINNGQPLVAFRIPAHPVTLQLLRQLPFPVVAPSANLFTSISPTTTSHVMKYFRGQIPFILEGGACSIGVESTVVGFDEDGNPVVYRTGAITAAEIAAVTGREVIVNQGPSGSSPGTTPHHYSPVTPFYLVSSVHQLPAEVDVLKTGLLCFREKNSRFPANHQFVLSVEGNLHEAAKNLYKGLHYLDEKHLSFLVAEKLPNIGLGITVNDRLQRATHSYRYRFEKPFSLI